MGIAGQIDCCSLVIDFDESEALIDGPLGG
jgi:hypothetical protein